MIRLFSRFRPVRMATLKRTGSLNRVLFANRVRGCASNLSGNKLANPEKSTDLFDNEFMRSAALDEKSVRQPAREPTTSDIDAAKSSSLKGLYDCESMLTMLNWIEENMFRIKSDELPEVYSAISQVIYDLRRKNLVQRSLEGSLQMLRTSNTFRLLLTHTEKLLQDFDNQQLLTLFETFQLTGLDSRKPIVCHVISLLSKRLNQLHLAGQVDLNLIVSCLKFCQFYQQSKSSEQLFTFHEQLLAIATQLILDSKFNLNDVHHLEQLFLIFLMPSCAPDFQVVGHLSKLILTSGMEIDFKESVLILKQIIRAYSQTESKLINLPRHHELRKLLDKSELYPRVLSKLIDYCNATIFRALNSESLATSEAVSNLYLMKVHAGVNSVSKEFENFHDARLLDPLARYLLQSFDTHDRLKYIAFNLVQNYARTGYYHEPLLKFTYDYYCSATDRFRSNQSPRHIYNLFSKVRLPFVNHQRLATEYLFNFSDEFYRMISSDSINAIWILSALVLNDVFDARLFAYLNTMVKNRSTTIFSTGIYKQVALARNYLMIFHELTTLKLETADILNNLMAQCNIINRPLIAPSRLSRLENKIQPNAYLSNGVYVDSFAIFDRNSEDLVPLAQYMDLFCQIDCIPLKKSQQM